jgi:hypothetical protein
MSSTAVPSTFDHLNHQRRKKRRRQLHNFAATTYNIAQRNISMKHRNFWVCVSQHVRHVLDTDTQMTHQTPQTIGPFNIFCPSFYRLSLNKARVTMNTSMFLSKKDQKQKAFEINIIVFKLDMVIIFILFWWVI